MENPSPLSWRDSKCLCWHHTNKPVFLFQNESPPKLTVESLKGKPHLSSFISSLEAPLFFFSFSFLPAQGCLVLERDWVGAALPFWLIRVGQRGTRVRAERRVTCRAPSANCFLSLSPLNTQAPNYRLSWRKRAVETESWGFEWGLQGSKTLFIFPLS